MTNEVLCLDSQRFRPRLARPSLAAAIKDGRRRTNRPTGAVTAVIGASACTVRVFHRVLWPAAGARSAIRCMGAEVQGLDLQK